MTREQKDILLKDLCARLPYGVKIYYKTCDTDGTEHVYDGYELYDISKDWQYVTLVDNETDTYVRNINLDNDDFYTGKDNVVFKPYLRSENKLTSKEWDKITSIDMSKHLMSSYHLCIPKQGEVIDYLNSHMIDWRNLIYFGLAIDAPDEMYS